MCKSEWSECMCVMQMNHVRKGMAHSWHCRIHFKLTPQYFPKFKNVLLSRCKGNQLHVASSHIRRRIVCAIDIGNALKLLHFNHQL